MGKYLDGDLFSTCHKWQEWVGCASVPLTLIAAISGLVSQGHQPPEWSEFLCQHLSCISFLDLALYKLSTKID